MNERKVIPLTLIQAKEVAHSLSEPSKMPGYGYSLPASACITGMKLKDIKGSICSKCYACKGHYVYSNVRKALQKRLEAIEHPDWVPAMVTLLQYKDSHYFRWHDSGDIQSVEHLGKIADIALQLPHMQFWLPTKEANILRDYLKVRTIPENLIIRLSSAMINQKPPSVKRWKGQVQTSSVHDKDKSFVGFECQAYMRGNMCGPCRVCWDKNIDNISYRRH